MRARLSRAERGAESNSLSIALARWLAELSIQGHRPLLLCHVPQGPSRSARVVGAVRTVLGYSKQVARRRVPECSVGEITVYRMTCGNYPLGAMIPDR